MSKSLYETAQLKENDADKATIQVATDLLKKAGLKHSGKMQVTRAYGWGAEVQAAVGTLSGNHVWLEVSIRDLDKGKPTADIALRVRMGSNSKTIATNASIKELGRLISKIT